MDTNDLLGMIWEARAEFDADGNTDDRDNSGK